MRRYRLVTLLCALLATALAPSTLRAAYAEVDRPAVQATATGAVESQPAPASDVEPAAAAPVRFTPLVPQPSPPRFNAPFYLLYCSLLR